MRFEDEFLAWHDEKVQVEPLCKIRKHVPSAKFIANICFTHGLTSPASIGDDSDPDKENTWNVLGKRFHDQNFSLPSRLKIARILRKDYDAHVVRKSVAILNR